MFPMSQDTMPRPAFADADASSRPLHVVAPDGLADFLAGQPPATAAWLGATGFEAAPGELRLIPGVDGSVQAAVAGLGTAKARARGRFPLA